MSVDLHPAHSAPSIWDILKAVTVYIALTWLLQVARHHSVPVFLQNKDVHVCSFAEIRVLLHGYNRGSLVQAFSAG